MAFLTVTYPPSIGGAQVHVQRVAEGLATRDHQVEVITTDAARSPAGRRPGHVGPSHELLGGVSVRRIPFARRTHALLRGVDRVRLRVQPDLDVERPLRLGPHGVRFVNAAIAAGRRSDVVVGCPAPYSTVLAPRIVARGGAAAVAMPLLHLTGGDPVPEVRWALRGCQGLTSSTSVERDALVRCGVDRERIAVLPPGCDPDRHPDVSPSEARRRLGLPDRPTVGYLGRLAAYKGIDTLLDASRRLWSTHPGTTVVIAGSAVGWEGLDALVASVERDAGDRLVVRRDFPAEDKAHLLASCDVVVLPSREESFGMVTAEAWCARRPVVAADIPAVRCVIEDGVDGDLVPAGDADRLADAVTCLLEDPRRAQRYGEAGRRKAETDLSWDHVLDGWEELLADAVARRRIRR